MQTQLTGQRRFTQSAAFPIARQGIQNPFGVETASSGHPDPLGDIAVSGSQVFPGFEPADATDQSRNNFGIYADAEADVARQFRVNAAARFETKWKWFFEPAEVKPDTCSLSTEKTLQMFSFGVMQVMGANFRHYGFRGWLTEIASDLRTQLEYGCLMLATFIKRHGFEGGIASYNNGQPDRDHDGKIDNPDYVAKVLSHAAEY
jgi:hypothetical protein